MQSYPFLRLSVSPSWAWVDIKQLTLTM